MTVTYGTIQIRRATAAEAAANNVVLSQGEPGFETDTGKLKIGNGTSHWNDLAYASDPAAVQLAASAVQAADLDAATGGLLANPASATSVALLSGMTEYVSPGADNALADAVDGRIGAQLPSQIPPTMWFLINMGQSNADGNNSAAAGATIGNLAYYDTVNIDVPNPRIFAWQGSGAHAGQLVEAVEPLLGPASTNATGMGPSGPLARELLADIGPRDVICIVQTAVGSTGYGADSNPNGNFRWQVADVISTVNLHTNAVEMTDAAIAAAQAAGFRAQVFAVVEQMGEADGDGGTTGAAYAAFMAASIADFRTRYGAGVLYLLGRMMPARRDSTATGPDIDLAVQNAPSTIELCAVRPPLDPAHNQLGDGTHADAGGQRINGHEAYRSVARALANVKGVIPVPVANLTLTAQGASVTASWDAPSTGQVTGVHVSWNHGGAGYSSLSLLPGTATSVTFDAIAGAEISVRVVAQSAAGNSGTATAAITTIPAQSGPLSGLTAGIQRAQGLRRIVSGYSGSAIQVRRSSDSTAQDIGFSGDDLDTAALLAFVGAGDGFVTTWYDQSGNGRNLTQTTAAAQPKIVSTGVLVTNGKGKPAIQFDGAATTLTSTATGMYAAGSSYHALILEGTTPASSTVFGETRPTAANVFIIDQFVATANLLVVNYNDQGQILRQGALMPTTTTFYSVVDDGAAFTQQVNGAVLEPMPYTRYATPSPMTLTQIGALTRSGGTSGYYGGKISELIIFYTVPSDADRDIVASNMRAYQSI